MEHERVALAVGEERHVADTRVERVAVERHALPLELRPPRGDVVDPQRDVRAVRRELAADPRRVDQIEADVAGLDLGPPVVPGRAVHAQRVPVERLRALHVLHQDRHEVGPLDRAQPTDPSIWSWISRFISTAYSSGSSFVIGSTNPDTIIALASASESPRDKR